MFEIHLVILESNLFNIGRLILVPIQVMPEPNPNAQIAFMLIPGCRYLTAWADVARIGTTPRHQESRPKTTSRNVNDSRRNQNKIVEQRNQRLMFQQGNRQRRRPLRRTRL